MSEPSLHHAGYVVASIAESVDRWRATLAAISVSQIWDDPIQQARVVFLEFAPGVGTTLELVEPLNEAAPTSRFLQKGGGLHHLCFEVDNLDAHLLHMKSLKAMLIRKPQPAAAFGQRRIAWMLLPDRMLVEYLERTCPPHVQ